MVLGFEIQDLLFQRGEGLWLLGSGLNIVIVLSKFVLRLVAQLQPVFQIQDCLSFIIFNTVT